MTLLTIVLSILLLVAIVYVLYEYIRKIPKRKLVGYVAGLRTHPVKSGKPIVLSKAEITPLGVKHDRQFVLLNKFGTLMTMRKHPKFVLLDTTVTEDCIIAQGEGMHPLNLPLSMKKEDGDYKNIDVFGKSTIGVHVSDEADEWFAKYLDVEGCKLYSYPSDGVPRYPKDMGVKNVENYTNEKDSLMFADDCPMLLASEGSAESIDKDVDGNVTIGNFRPNIIITGCAPFAEETWGLIEINDVQMQALFPCGRCNAINVDPKSAEVSKTILPEVTRIKNAKGTGYKYQDNLPLFGMFYGIRKPGFINVGDPIYDLVLTK